MSKKTKRDDGQTCDCQANTSFAFKLHLNDVHFLTEVMMVMNDPISRSPSLFLSLVATERKVATCINNHDFVPRVKFYHFPFFFPYFRCSFSTGANKGSRKC